MTTLKTIKKRIGSVGNTKKLTRAMKMIAAARLRKVQTRAVEARVFNGELKRVLTETGKNSNLAHPLLRLKEEKCGEIDLVVFTSDRGLCGVFNEALLDLVGDYIQAKKKEGITVHCIVFGKKGKGRGYFHLPDKDVREVLVKEMKGLVERYLAGAIDEAAVAYNRFKSVGTREVVIETILPVAGGDIVEKYGIDYIYEPGRAEVIGWLIENLLESNLYQAYLESYASELAARMVAMDMATKNAEDLIKVLTMQFNKARQASITRELIDIVGGAEAMK